MNATVDVPVALRAVAPQRPRPPAGSTAAASSNTGAVQTVCSVPTTPTVAAGGTLRRHPSVMADGAMARLNEPKNPPKQWRRCNEDETGKDGASERTCHGCRQIMSRSERQGTRRRSDATYLPARKPGGSNTDELHSWNPTYCPLLGRAPNAIGRKGFRTAYNDGKRKRGNSGDGSADIGDSDGAA